MDLTNPTFIKALFHPDNGSNAPFLSWLSLSFTISFFCFHSWMASRVNKLFLEQFYSLVGFPEPPDFGDSQGFLFDLPISIQSLSTKIQNVTLSFFSLDSSEILSCSIFFPLPHLKLQVVSHIPLWMSDCHLKHDTAKKGFQSFTKGMSPWK